MIRIARKQEEAQVEKQEVNDAKEVKRSKLMRLHEESQQSKICTPDGEESEGGGSSSDEREVKEAPGKERMISCPECNFELDATRRQVRNEKGWGNVHC